MNRSEERGSEGRCRKDPQALPEHRRAHCAGGSGDRAPDEAERLARRADRSDGSQAGGAQGGAGEESGSAGEGRGQEGAPAGGKGEARQGGEAEAERGRAQRAPEGSAGEGARGQEGGEREIRCAGRRACRERQDSGRAAGRAEEIKRHPPWETGIILSLRRVLCVLA